MERLTVDHSHLRDSRILLVEDAVPTQLLVQLLLEDHFHVATADSAEQAQIQSLEETPDLILLDINLAEDGMSGLELCKDLKSRAATRHIPIIFLTSAECDDTEEACWNAGGQDFIRKPINETTLLNRIRNQLILKRQAENLTRMAYVDPLTCSFNRRYFEEQLNAQVAHNARHHRSMSLLMLDIDNFKRVNDTYGHTTGDECLELVASALREEVGRPMDQVCRYGGEEFAILLPETDLTGATWIAGKINKRFRDRLAEIPSGGVDEEGLPGLTVSIGVACRLPSEGVKSLICRADQALYQAKQSGRDCFCVAEVYPDHPALMGV
ncbi:diguanylate cyclase [Mangrovimicrobium sediminis]|nr:diguanylate cyclase [Haliea sp. SAOS-164]